MKNVVLWCCAAVSLLSGCSQSNWKVVEKKSEMGNGLEITATVESPREVKNLVAVAHPFLRIQISEGRAQLIATPLLGMHFEPGRNVSWADVRVRFDEEEPFEVQVVQRPQMDSRLAVFPTPTARALIGLMRKHDVMKIEWTTLFGKQVDSFAVKGVGHVIDGLCEKVPSSCTGDSPLGAEPLAAPATPEVAPPPRPGPQLAEGKYPVASSQWKQARELAIAWCKSNANACDESVVQELNRPRTGAELEVGGDEAHLSTCTYENCPGVLTDVTLKKIAGSWTVSGVELRPLGD